MTTLLSLILIAGIGLGLRCNVVVLVPALIASAMVGVLAAMMSGWSVLGVVAAMTTVMQLAYLAGVLARSALAPSRISARVLVRSARPI